ncbi:MAG TPA: hypothetical protein VND64_22405 [Pirellulales bacterium]|nr:hypothetical protein [Pirellulales bacterium]
MAARGRWRRRGRGGLVLAMVCFSANAASAQKEAPSGDPPTCALIDFDRSPLAAVLEAKLLAEVKATWLERNAIDEVVKEQELQALFTPEGGSERVALGKLLKADLLILVRDAPPSAADESAKAPPTGEKRVMAIDLAVTETRRGLRLCSRAVPRTDDAEADADTLVQLLREALAKYAQEITEIYAVPPFVSRDLGYEHEYLRVTYARLLEQVLLERRGALVVELAEARSLAKEVALTDAGARLTRDVPFYLLGQYRNEGQSGERRVSLSLKLMRGEQELDKRLKRGAQPGEAATTLQKFAAEMVEKAAGAKHAAVDSAAEVDALNRREKLFSRLGQWPDALALAEASLLLKPGQAEMHHDAIVALTHLTMQNWDTYPLDIQKQWRTVAYQGLGLEHIEALGRLGGQPQTYDERGVRGFLLHFFRATGGNVRVNALYPPERNETIVALQKSRQAALPRIIEHAVRAGWKDEHVLLEVHLEQLPLEEQFDEVVRLIEQTKDLPGAKQRTRYYAHCVKLAASIRTAAQRYQAMKPLYDRMASIDNAEVQAMARQLERDEQSIVKQAEAKEASEMESGVREAQARAKSLPATGVHEIEFIRQGGDADGRLQAFDGCLPAGPGIDVVWAGNALFLMKQPGQLRLIWQGGINWRFDTLVANAPRNHVCYDGRFVWAAPSTYGGAAARLLVVDPQTEAVAEFTVEDGLPQSRTIATGSFLKQFMAIAPLSPGKICVAGSFGQTWLAVATIEPPGRKSLKVFHEARDAFDQENTDQPKGTDVAFPPSFMFAFRDDSRGKRGPRVIVGRGELQSAQPGEYPPLLIDSEKLSVEALVPAAYLELRLQSNYAARADACQDGIYQVFGTAPPKFKPALFRSALPDFKPEAVLEDVPDGFVALTGEHLHIVGRDWWTCRIGDKEPRRVAESLPWWFRGGWYVPGRPPEPPEPPEVPRIEAIFHSNHYGLLVKRARSKLHEATTFDVSGLLQNAAGAPSSDEVKTKRVK